MELLSFSLSGKFLLLSGSEDGLYLHTIQNQHFGRPLLLCSGYKNGLSGCISGDSAYYTYINKENALLLRRLYDPTVPFRLDCPASVTYRSPQLFLFHHILFLFYWEVEQDNTRLKLCLPFSDLTPELPDALATPYSGSPQLHVQTTEHYLYLILTTGAASVAYRYTTPVSFEPLCTETELLSALQLPWETEKAQLEQTILRSIHLSEQQQALLAEKEQKLHTVEARLSNLSSDADQANASLLETMQALQAAKTQLEESEQNRQQTAQALTHTSFLLERAKSQYSELMQVAEQYRQEAMKWYGKFTDRN